MNIRIDDNVPLPQPDKPDTWVTGKPATMASATVARLLTPIRSTDPELDAALAKDAAYIEAMGGDSGPTLADFGWQPRYASATDCTFVGGPLNGQFGPIKGNAKIVEIELYDDAGNVTSVELYALGDNPTPMFRYHVGSKAP